MENRVKQYLNDQSPAAAPASFSTSENPKFLFVELRIPLNHPWIHEICFTVQYLWSLILKK
jgi:hypothetical protein